MDRLADLDNGILCIEELLAMVKLYGESDCVLSERNLVGETSKDRILYAMTLEGRRNLRWSRFT